MTPSKYLYLKLELITIKEMKITTKKLIATLIVQSIILFNNKKKIPESTLIGLSV